MHPSFILLTAGLVLIVAGTALNISSRTAVRPDTGFPPQVRQEHAQAHFHLGVATCNLIITKHLLAGEPVPDGPALYLKCVAHDIKVSEGKSLLKMPEDGK